MLSTARAPKPAVASSTTLFTPESDQQLEDVRALPGPGGRAVELTGIAAINADTLTSITARLPAVLGIVAAVTFALLFLLTGAGIMAAAGSVLLAAKALTDSRQRLRLDLLHPR